MDIPETKLFGDLLKQYRRYKNLTQEGLAHKIDMQGRGSVQAWEQYKYLPHDRKIVLTLARVLDLSDTQTDELLLAANYAPEYRTQATSVPTIERSEHLDLIDVYIDEDTLGEIPLIDITLQNKTTQTILPTRIQMEILDVGEFPYYDSADEDDDPTRGALPVSGRYDVELSPALQGKRVSIKIAHYLHPDEPERIQLRVSQNETGWSFAYVWYYLKVAILYGNPGRIIETQPILLSIPPVDHNIMDIRHALNSPYGTQMKATLQRMSAYKANRSASVESTFHQIVGE